MKNLKIIFLLICLVLSGCVTAKFQPGKPVEVEGGFYNRRVTQDGKLVNALDVYNELKKNKQTEEFGSRGQTFFVAAMTSAGAGGFLVGYNLFRDSGGKEGGLLIGAALIGISVWTAYYADKNLLQGLEIYNHKFHKKTASVFSIKPTVALVSEQRFRFQTAQIPTLGLSFSY